ncbi:hypothetical protein, partial [Acinetobacter haemolyticus]
TMPINGLGNSFAVFGDSTNNSVNNGSTTTVNYIEDNDSIDNSNSGAGVGGAAGNGIGGGLLNGVGSGNGEQ